MYYVKIGAGLFLGFLLGELVVERELTVRTVVKAALGALIGLGIIAWWAWRKRDSGAPPA